MIFKQTLAKNGYRLTKDRLEIFQTINRFQRPFTALDLVNQLKKSKRSIHKTTVYRDLNLLVKLNLLNSFSIAQNDADYFELSSKGHHHHFVCEICLKIFDISPKKIELAIEKFSHNLKTRGFNVKKHHFKIYGTCKNCQEIDLRN